MADLHDTVRIEPVPESSLLLETCSTLLSSKCCHNFLIDFNFDDHDCLKFALSKGLGYGIIVASTLVKLPQVVKILNAKSGAGISVFGTILELLAITFNASYSYGKKFPFAAWGEALFLLFETGLIAFLVLWYDKKKIRSILGVILYAGILYVLMSGRTPIDVLWKLQALNLPLAISGKGNPSRHQPTGWSYGANVLCDNNPSVPWLCGANIYFHSRNW
ncbi:Mannose-P-dolichol utilization defect 1 -like protein [Halotydeus destructor]|nr:Mannose-P-dolichol utilization defect 1 -like protein [Halotydeus destructor]